MKRLLLSALCLLCFGLATWMSRAEPTTEAPPAAIAHARPLVKLPSTLEEQPRIAVADEKLERGRLELSIIDAATGKATPARVEVRGDDGRFYVADNPLPSGTFVFYNFNEGEPRTPAKEMFSGQRASVRNPFTDTEEFYTAGDCRVSLAPGRYRVRVTKGPEFRRAVETVQVDAGKPQALTMRLERWANPPAAGWYSCDPHVHVARTAPAVNQQVLRWMQAEDLHVTNLLQWGHAAMFANTPQYAHGPEGVYREGDYLLASGQENPRSGFLGHTIILGAQRPLNEPDAYLYYRPVFEEAHRQGAVNGYAHKGTWSHAQNGLALDLPHKVIDFLEILQFGTVEYSVWYTILNTGFRMTPVAGTDYPIFPIPGWDRFYTRVEGEFSFETWLEGVRKGRTFISTGPLVEFSVDGRGIGDDISLTEPRPLRIVGKVRFDPERDDVERLEVIANGQVLRTFAREPKASEIGCDFTFEPNEATWLALRADGKKTDAHESVFIFQLMGPSRRKGEAPPPAPAVAHTAPVYITIQGRPTLAEHPRAKGLASAWLGRLGEMEVLLSKDLQELPSKLDSGPSSDGASLEVFRRDRDVLLKALAEARTHFTKQGGAGAVSSEAK